MKHVCVVVNKYGNVVFIGTVDEVEEFNLSDYHSKYVVHTYVVGEQYDSHVLSVIS